MTLHLARFVFTTLALIGFAGSAQALQFAELTLDDCDMMGCEGATLYLSLQEQTNGDWIATYTINTDGSTTSLAGFNQVGFKAITGWTSAEVISSPVGSMTNPVPYDALVPWNPVTESPIASNSLCEKTNGQTDKICAAGFVNITSGGDYTWVILIEGGTLITDTSEWHLGAQYADGRYRSTGHIISAHATPIPEPTAALLFGLGALLVTRSVKRR